MSGQTKLALRWGLVVFLTAVLLIGAVGRAEAVVIDGDGLIPAGETIDDDVVLGATRIKVDGTVNGALVAGGQDVTINGVIHGDALIAGQTLVLGPNAVIDGNLFFGGSLIQVSGKVGGSIFGGGAALVLNETASVGRNVYFGGFHLEAKTGAKLGRDVNAGAYQVLWGGTARNASLAAAAIEISGTLQGDATLWVSNAGAEKPNTAYWQFNQPGMPAAVEPGLRIAESAKIAGKLTYTSEVQQSSSIQAVPGGGIVYQTPTPRETPQRRAPAISAPNLAWEGFWVWSMLRNLATILILGGLVLWRIPAVLQRSLLQLRQRSLATMGVGLLSLLGVLLFAPLAVLALVLLGAFFAVLTLVDIAGIIWGLGLALLGISVAVYFVFFAWAGKLMLAYLIGSWLLAKLAPQATPAAFWQLALGALVLALLAAIPVAGFLLTFLADLAGMGALWYAWKLRAVVE